MTDWSEAGMAGPYSVWNRDDCNGSIWNVSYGDRPSPNTGGYSSLAALLRLKGLSEADFVPLSDRGVKL